MSTTFRNPTMLARIEKHPLKTALARCMDVAETFQGDCEHVRINPKLSDTGRAAEIERHLRAALRDMRDARAPLEALKVKVQTKQAAVKQPEFDRTDVVGVLNRQELRAALRTMPLGERQAILTGANANHAFVDAALEQPPALSGFAANPMELKIYEQVQHQRLRALFGPQLNEIAELQSQISEAEMILDVAKIDMSAQSGMQQEKFTHVLLRIETKADAPWLIRGAGDATTRVVEIDNGVASYRPATPDEIRDGVFFKNEAEYRAARAA